MKGDTLLSTPVRVAGFLVSITIATFSLSTAYLWGSSGLLLRTFVVSVVGWTGYLFAHYFAEGTFIDGAPETAVETTVQHKIGVLVGSAVLITGMVIGSIGVRNDAALVTHGAAALFVTGYIIAHYAATEEIL